METYIETIITIHETRTTEAMDKAATQASRSPKLRRSWPWRIQHVPRRVSRPAH